MIIEKAPTRKAEKEKTLTEKVRGKGDRQRRKKVDYPAVLTCKRLPS